MGRENIPIMAIAALALYVALLVTLAYVISEMKHAAAGTTQRAIT